MTIGGVPPIFFNPGLTYILMDFNPTPPDMNTPPKRFFYGPKYSFQSPLLNHGFSGVFSIKRLKGLILASSHIPHNLVALGRERIFNI
jgi:hypothetical protein